MDWTKLAGAGLVAMVLMGSWVVSRTSEAQGNNDPAAANTLTIEITEDTEKAFELRVTECVWANVFRDAGLGGRVGQAAVCIMDYVWPPAFNENFKMERTKTLMQGDDHCNHRYLDTA